MAFSRSLKLVLRMLVLKENNAGWEAVGICGVEIGKALKILD